MNPDVWLSRNAIGFDCLSNDEKSAILHFTLLWGLFEHKLLECKGSSRKICGLVKKWEKRGILNFGKFTESLNHFKSRYYCNGELTGYFKGLNLRSNDEPALVENVVSGKNTCEADKISALFIIIYRLRNNLFHGEKWGYEIQGQLDNFIHANQALMTALEMNNSTSRGD